MIGKEEKLKGPISLIAVDIDGTLVNKEKELLPKTRNVLLTAQEQGIRLALVSGRAVSGLTRYEKLLQMRTYGGFLVGINGGEVYDCATGQFLKKTGMDRDLCRRYFAFWHTRQVSRYAYGEKYLYTDHPDAYCLESLSVCNCLEPRFINLDEPSLPEEPMKLMITGDPSYLEKEREKIPEELRKSLSLTFSSPNYLEAMNPGITKAVGLSFLQEKLQIPKSELWVFGDGENDMPMLRIAGHAVVMETAVDLVKTVADGIAPSSDKDGIGVYLAPFLEKK